MSCNWQTVYAEIKWKFTDEYRNILGYDCRRVNGIMQDSVYIVAFYTPQIPVSGGPGVDKWFAGNDTWRRYSIL